MKTSTEYIIKKDGAAWCAHAGDFVNLQESQAEFGDTPVAALAALLISELIEEERRCEGIRDWKCNCCTTLFSAGRVKSGEVPACPQCKAGGQFVYETTQ